MALVTWKTIVISIGVLLVDLGVYVFLGLLLMNYDDLYEASKGAYWSWASMNAADHLTVVALNFWHGVNLLALTYIGFRAYRTVRKGGLQSRKHV